MSLIHLEKQGDHWRSRVEGRFILGAHPIETVRKGLPEAMAQAVVDHCAMSGEDAAVFAQRLMAEIGALSPAAYPVELMTPAQIAEARGAMQNFILPEGSKFLEVVEPSEIANRVAVQPRRARVPRKAAVVAPEAEQAPVEPATAPGKPV